MLNVWHLIKGTFKIETLVNPDDCHWSNVSAQVVNMHKFGNCPSKAQSLYFWRDPLSVDVIYRIMMYNISKSQMEEHHWYSL
jgi:hypothetical protein